MRASSIPTGRAREGAWPRAAGDRPPARQEAAVPPRGHELPAAALDRASGFGLLEAVQRTAGNRSAVALARRWTSVQRWEDRGEGMEIPEEDGEAAAARAAEARASAVLANGRFTGIPRLAALVRGGPALSARDNGAAVEAVQLALLDIGYSLLQYQHDGHWGAETESAISLFRADAGLGAGGGMDAEAIEALDSAAPPPGVATEHTVDYDRLFEDDRLDVALAIGYDEGGAHERKLELAHTLLGDRGFTRTDEEGSTDPVEHWSVTRDLTFPTGSGERATRAITVEVQLITPGTGSAARFGQALSEAELTLYTGHGRRGIGPDFDPDRSPAENFIIGVGSALHDAGRAVEPRQVEQHHYVIDRVNDLEAMAAERDPATGAPRFDPERYRVWFFNACTTLAYMDELRGGILPEGADRRNLDLFGTRATVPTAAGMATTFALLDGVMNAQSMEEIVRTMGRISAEAAAANGFSRREAQRIRDAYWREGAADNPLAPAGGGTVAPEGAAP